MLICQELSFNGLCHSGKFYGNSIATSILIIKGKILDSSICIIVGKSLRVVLTNRQDISTVLVFKMALQLS